MNDASKYYHEILKNYTVPVRFCYDDKKYSGLTDCKFLSATNEKAENSERSILSFGLRELKIEVVLTLYEKYNALDYVVMFTCDDGKSKVLKKIEDVAYEIDGAEPVVSGILGDHKNRYLPYEKYLSREKVHFKNFLGRATHWYFPFFDWNSRGKGMRFALGWGGTWEAEFTYKENKTFFTGKSTLGLKTYLKKGETIRTSRVCMLFYCGDRESGTNAWRRFVVDCVMPKQDGRPVPPFTTTCLAMDTGRPNSDGSVSEYDGSYKRSLDAFYNSGLTADFRWFDAGWYFDPYEKTIVSRWQDTGSWELDTEKWKGDSFLDSVRFAREHGTKTFVWFEPEAVTGIDGLETHYGYKRKWALERREGFLHLTKRRRSLNNLGDEECLIWTKNRILDFFKKYDVDMYREDMNMDPIRHWKQRDRKEGFFRKGITENKYMQGHYKLWDEILTYCDKHDKCTFIDSCASGGGRNDYESMFRSVPVLRSDADRTSISLRLAFTSSLSQWLPFGGCCVKESKGELDVGNIDDMYIFRASYLPAFNLSAEWYHKKDFIRYDLFRQALKEWSEIKEFFYKDFYLLTPYARYDDDTKWTVFEYFDPETEKGVVQAFRQNECTEGSITVRVRGVDAEKSYKIRSVDGGEWGVDGRNLFSWTISASENRSALIFYVERVE